MSGFREEFKNSSNQYRSAPFWVWNQDIKTEKIPEQIKAMKDQKLGGCFIHSREGLETPYLSDEWMECVKATVDAGKENDFDIWIYDEDKWPSGMAGGMVTEKYTQYRAKALTMHLNEDGTRDYNIEETGNTEWYNGFGPADNLSYDSVKAFLEITHEAYKKSVGEEFGTGIKGFFTDEPNVCDFFARFSEGNPWLPWSDGFEEAFEKSRGYKIQEYYDALFFESEDSPKVCHDYFKTLTEQFKLNYFKQIDDWMHEHNMKTSGHLIFENDFGYNPRTSGSIMPHYEYLDIPGIDLLGEQTEEILTVKQCTSVANQFGKKHVGSESYGCGKWELGLEGQKWLGDWQFIMGVNMRSHHVFTYSLKGLRKRDLPPVYSYQTTWYDYTHLLEDYFGRFAVCNTYGEVKRDVLVLHPQSSMWLKAWCRPDENMLNWDDDMGWIDQHFLDGNAIGYKYQLLIKGLLAAHLDCDLGDEMLMEEHGFLKDHKIYIKNAGYKIVVIPEIDNIFASTVQLLKEFMEQGGKIIALGEAPRYLDGKASEVGKALYADERIIKCNHINQVVTQVRLCSNDINVWNDAYREDEDIMTMYREIPEGSMLICSNHDRERAHSVMIRMKGQGAIEELDLATGESKWLTVKYDVNEGKMEFVTDLKEVETKVYILHEGKEYVAGTCEFAYHHPHASKEVFLALEPKAKVTRNMPNAIILDNCKYKVQEDWSDEMPVWQAQRDVRDALKMKQIWSNSLQQRYLWAHIPHENDGTPVELAFTFEVADLAIENLEVAVEDGKLFQVACNGTIISKSGEESAVKGYYLDKIIEKIAIPKELVKLGANVLTFRMNYTQKMELEDIYVLGDFAVNQERQLEKEKGILQLGDWCLQGYPHYGGVMSYHYVMDKHVEDGRALYLHVGDCEAAVVEVIVNGTSVGCTGWRGKSGLEITEYLYKDKPSEIIVNVVSTPRNVFGPFHQKYDRCVRSNSKDYRTVGDEYTSEYILKAMGLMEPIVITYSSDK